MSNVFFQQLGMPAPDVNLAVGLGTNQPTVTHQLADLLFTPSEDTDANLQRERIPRERIFRVGNVMIDSLVRLLPAAQKTRTDGLPERYALVTLHRPANVDDSVTLKGIL
jgi:UDP-N-acetylglucosamine 2-epimerase (non-hydrolysing)